ncbi:MAG: chorismate mutase [Acidobacteria bacterium]|nr:chorismate mutase [Acidobacteriota bacterium]
MSVADLGELRRAIDEIDEQLVVLLNQRAAHALEVGRIKHAAGMAVYQPAREAEVLAHVCALNAGPLDDGAVTRLFERVIDENRRLERLADAARAIESTERGE